MSAPVMRRLLPAGTQPPADGDVALHFTAATRRIESAALAAVPPGATTLMQRAGLAVGRFALARFPQARRVWIAAGPGNNGGDAIEAGARLKQLGRDVHLTWLGHPGHVSADTARALQAARDAGLEPQTAFPSAPVDLVIDGLLGIGVQPDRPPHGAVGDAIAAVNASGAPVLAVDLPSGLLPDTGAELSPCIAAAATLTFLSAKPGFFTAHGRDRCGEVWLDLLGTDTRAGVAPDAWLHLQPYPQPARPQESNKGSYGDVAVIGGAPGMGGAPLLAGRAAMAAGAGRVYVAPLDAQAAHVDALHPELMFRDPATLALERMTVACGCGGGQAVQQLLPDILARAARLVLDADGLNAVAGSEALRADLVARAAAGRPTVLTPHPLEAARLLGDQVAHVQADRFAAARALADRLQCVVVLKGSGSLVAAPGAVTVVNASGNPALATAGTGDVLAGWLAGHWSACAHQPLVACIADGVWWHGHAADRWRDTGHAGAIAASTLTDWLAHRAAATC